MKRKSYKKIFSFILLWLSLLIFFFVKPKTILAQNIGCKLIINVRSSLISNIGSNIGDNESKITYWDMLKHSYPPFIFFQVPAGTKVCNITNNNSKEQEFFQDGRLFDDCAGDKSNSCDINVSYIALSKTYHFTTNLGSVVTCKGSNWEVDQSNNSRSSCTNDLDKFANAIESIDPIENSPGNYTINLKNSNNIDKNFTTTKTLPTPTPASLFCTLNNGTKVPEGATVCGYECNDRYPSKCIDGDYVYICSRSNSMTPTPVFENYNVNENNEVIYNIDLNKCLNGKRCMVVNSGDEYRAQCLSDENAAQYFDVMGVNCGTTPNLLYKDADRCCNPSELLLRREDLEDFQLEDADSDEKKAFDRFKKVMSEKKRRFIFDPLGWLFGEAFTEMIGANKKNLEFCKPGLVPAVVSETDSDKVGSSSSNITETQTYDLFSYDQTAGQTSLDQCICVDPSLINKTYSSQRACDRYFLQGSADHQACTDCKGYLSAIGCIPTVNFFPILFRILIGLAGLIALFCIIYSAIQLQLSQGSPEKIKKAQEWLTSCIAGLMLLIFSVFILKVIGFDILRIF